MNDSGLRAYFESEEEFLEFAKAMKHVTDSVDRRYMASPGESAGHVWGALSDRYAFPTESRNSRPVSEFLRIAATIASRYHVDRFRERNRQQAALRKMQDAVQHKTISEFSKSQMACASRAFASLSSDQQQLVDARYSVYPGHSSMTALARKRKCSRDTAYKHALQVLSRFRRHYETEMQDAADY